MLAAIITGIVVMLLTNLIWIVRHNRIISNLKQAHKAELESEMKKEWSIGFSTGWDAVLNEYMVMKKRIKELEEK